MTRRELIIVALSFIGVVLLVLMLFVTILGVAGRGIMGDLMRDTRGVMFFVMVFFPVFAVALLIVLSWWIFRREGW